MHRPGRYSAPMASDIVTDDGDTITTCWARGHTLQETFAAAAEWAAAHDGVQVEGITLERIRPATTITGTCTG
jgi:hypothetical protein